MTFNEMYLSAVSKFIRKEFEISKSELDAQAETKLAESIIQKYWTQSKTAKTKYLGKFLNHEFLVTNLSLNQSDLGYTISGKFDENGVKVIIVPGTAYSMISLMFAILLIGIGFYTKFIRYDHMTLVFIGLIFVSSIAIAMFKYMKYSEAELVALLKRPTQENSN